MATPPPSSKVPVDQKLADKPKDQALSVLLDNGKTMCYTPTSNQARVSLQACSSQTTPARYDVFSRVAWLVNNQWLCMSLNDDLTISLRPCTLNEPKQRFVVRNDAFFTPDLKLQVKHTKSGSLIAANPGDKKASSHTLRNMQTWIDTVALPAGINISTFIGWTFITREAFDIYYLRNDESVRNDPTDLIYNPETKQIAQFYPNDSSFLCINSTQTKNQDWNWIVFEPCNVNKQSQKWEIFLFGENSTAMLKDYNGNFFRVTKYGIHWGVPYTASAKYITTDTSNSPTSFFLFSHDMQDWQRFVSANIADELKYCPAPGFGIKQKGKSLGDLKQELIYELVTQNDKQILSQNPTLESPPLPPDFILNDAWVRRLWQISVSTDGSGQTIGNCGICLLQTYQMVAELMNNPSQPLSSGGYFFDTRPGVNPLLSFRNRYPSLARQLEETFDTNPQINSWREFQAYLTQLTRSMALTMLPGYFWTSSGYVDSGQMSSLFNQLLRSPVGNLWILHIHTRDASGAVDSHSLPVLRWGDGLFFIPTNIPSAASYEIYRHRLFNEFLARDVREVPNVLAEQGLTNIESLIVLAPQTSYENPISDSVSSNNCTGDGEDRRGSGLFPLGSMINQCSSGRCLIQ